MEQVEMQKEDAIAKDLKKFDKFLEYWCVILIIPGKDTENLSLNIQWCKWEEQRYSTQKNVACSCDESLCGMESD